MALTKIGWTVTILPDGKILAGFTFNGWYGCTKDSAGCAHCYAENMMDTRFAKVKWGPTGERKRTAYSYWQQPYKWDKEAAAGGIRRKVFCASLADVFEENEQLDAWRLDLFSLIEVTPNLDWLLLTKRPQNIQHMVPTRWLLNWPQHIWVGTSVENQREANRRIPELLDVPAPTRFLSCEPLLEEIEIEQWLAKRRFAKEDALINAVSWVICGGESGAQHRQMPLKAARSLLQQSRQANVPFFMKQLGGHPDKRENLEDMPEDLKVREFPG